MLLNDFSGLSESNRSENPLYAVNILTHMIGEIVENVVFDDNYWDEVLVFTRYEVQKHIDAGYGLDRYVESYDAWGRRRIFAQLSSEDMAILIFASPSDGIVVTRIPRKTTKDVFAE